MKNKKILTLCMASCLGMSSFLFGCNAKQDVKNTAEDVKDGVEKVGEGVKEGTESLVDKITDNSMTYSKEDFKKDLEKNNITPESVPVEKSFFSIDSDDYTINGQRISIYEYNESDSDKLNNDIGTITDNGLMINGNSVTWKVKPHIYKKGRIVVLYDGDDATTLNTLSSILGNPILG